MYLYDRVRILGTCTYYEVLKQKPTEGEVLNLFRKLEMWSWIARRGCCAGWVWAGLGLFQALESRQGVPRSKEIKNRQIGTPISLSQNRETWKGKGRGKGNGKGKLLLLLHVMYGYICIYGIAEEIVGNVLKGGEPRMLVAERTRTWIVITATGTLWYITVWGSLVEVGLVVREIINLEDAAAAVMPYEVYLDEGRSGCGDGDGEYFWHNYLLYCTLLYSTSTTTSSHMEHEAPISPPY